MIEQQERVRFTAAKLRRHIEYGGSFGFHTRQTSQNFNRQPGKALGQERSLEKARRVLVNLRGALVAHLIQMHRELGGIERFIIPQILPWCYDSCTKV